MHALSNPACVFREAIVLSLLNAHPTTNDNHPPNQQEPAMQPRQQQQTRRPLGLAPLLLFLLLALLCCVSTTCAFVPPVAVSVCVQVEASARSASRHLTCDTHARLHVVVCVIQ